MTCEDFVAAMAAASGFDFTQFMRWYSQPGTPHVAVDGHYDAESQTYTLTCTQSNRRASDEAPYLIPIRVALFSEAGNLLAGSERTVATNRRQPILRLPRRRRRTGAVAAARLLGAGLSRFRLHAGATGPARSPTSPTRSTPGKPASAWPRP